MYCLVLPCITVNYLVQNCPVLSYLVLHLLYCIALYYLALDCTALYNTALHRYDLYYTVLRFKVLHFPVLPYDILHCHVPYCTVPYCEGEQNQIKWPQYLILQVRTREKRIQTCTTASSGQGTPCANTLYVGIQDVKRPDNPCQGPTEECAKKEALTDDDRAELVKIHNDRRRR